MFLIFTYHFILLEIHFPISVRLNVTVHIFVFLPKSFNAKFIFKHCCKQPNNVFLKFKCHVFMVILST